MIVIHTYKDICGWACQTHGQGFQPLFGARQPEASERHYGHWCHQCRHGRMPPCSLQEPAPPSESEDKDIFAIAKRSNPFNFNWIWKTTCAHESLQNDAKHLKRFLTSICAHTMKQSFLTVLSWLGWIWPLFSLPLTDIRFCVIDRHSLQTQWQGACL